MQKNNLSGSIVNELEVAEKHGIQSAQKMAGHLNGKTTEIYTIFKEKRELEELKKISFK